MTHQEIKELAGHRAVPPWVMKLVGDAIAIEREACAKVSEEKGFNWAFRTDINPETAEKACMASQFIAMAIRARK